MNKILLLAFLLLSLTMFSCKNDKAEKIETPKTTETVKKAFVKKGKFAYTVIPDSTHVSWTAFKKSEKLPVSGSFKSITVENSHPGNNITEAIDGLKFSIPVSSIFSDDEDRDNNLRNSFFMKMVDTEFITGTIVAKSYKNAYVNLTMNGVTTNLPIRYKNTGTTITVTAIMNMAIWRVADALTSLNTACGDEHTGKDGVSKTWNEVRIHVKSRLLVN